MSKEPRPIMVFTSDKERADEAWRSLLLARLRGFSADVFRAALKDENPRAACDEHPNRYVVREDARDLDLMDPLVTFAAQVTDQQLDEAARDEIGSEYIFCGGCGGYHLASFYGDCRNDRERFFRPPDLADGVTVRQPDAL